MSLPDYSKLVMNVLESQRMSYSSICLRPFVRLLEEVNEKEDEIILNRWTSEIGHYDNRVHHTQLNSIEFPYYPIISALMDSGMALFTVCKVIAGVDIPPIVRTTLFESVSRICNQFSKLPPTSLFSSWSPKLSPPLRSIKVFNARSGLAEEVPVGQRFRDNSDDASNALDVNSSTFWTSKGKVGVWSADVYTVNLDKEITGVTLSAVKIAWALDVLAIVGAPKKLVIRVKVWNNENGCNPAYLIKTVLTIDIDAVRKGYPSKMHECDTWHHCYYVEPAVPNVVSIEILPSGTCSSNVSDSIRMYRFEAFTTENTVECFELLPLLRNSLQSFYPLINNTAEIRRELYLGVIGILKSSCSLELLLNCMLFILSNSSQSDCDVGTVCDKMQILCKFELMELIELVNNEYDIQLAKIAQVVYKDYHIEKIEVADCTNMVVLSNGTTFHGQMMNNSVDITSMFKGYNSYCSLSQIGDAISNWECDLVLMGDSLKGMFCNVFYCVLFAIFSL